MDQDQDGQNESKTAHNQEIREYDVINPTGHAPIPALILSFRWPSTTPAHVLHYY